MLKSKNLFVIFSSNKFQKHLTIFSNEGNTMRTLLCILAILLVCCSCNKQDSTQKTQGKLYVVATTGMVADIVQNVGGEHISADGLMGPGVDPHLYKATAADTKKLATADLIFYNGLHLEGKMGEILDKMGKKKPVYAVTQDIPGKLLHESDEVKDAHDPHIWFDVSLWKHAVQKVETVLCKVDPTHSKEYQHNSQAYQKKLDELHSWVKDKVSAIEKQSRVLVTAHDAFGYFGHAYDIEVVGLQGISTASDYGVKDVERIIDLLVKRKVRAVFVESSVPKKSIEAVVQGCAAQGHNVVIGGSLFSDAMGAPGTKEGTYVGMVEHNTNTIYNALASPKK